MAFIDRTRVVRDPPLRHALARYKRRSTPETACRHGALWHGTVGQLPVRLNVLGVANAPFQILVRSVIPNEIKLQCCRFTWMEAQC